MKSSHENEEGPEEETLLTDVHVFRDSEAVERIDAVVWNVRLPVARKLADDEAILSNDVELTGGLTSDLSQLKDLTHVPVPDRVALMGRERSPSVNHGSNHGSEVTNCCHLQLRKM